MKAQKKSIVLSANRRSSNSINIPKPNERVIFTRMTSQELKQNRVPVYDYMIP